MKRCSHRAVITSLLKQQQIMQISKVHRLCFTLPRDNGTEVWLDFRFFWAIRVTQDVADLALSRGVSEETTSKNNAKSR